MNRSAVSKVKRIRQGMTEGFLDVSGDGGEAAGAEGGGAVGGEEADTGPVRW